MKEALPIGVMVRFGTPPAASFKRLRDLGLHACQLAAPPDSYLYGAEGRRNTAELQAAIRDYEIEVTSLFISWPDQRWKDHANSIGLVPEATRAARLVRACRSADWGRELGIEQIASHVGAVPEDPELRIWQDFVRDLKPFVKFLGANGQILAYETGMESLAGLRALIDGVGEENQGLNFDPANLLIYNQEEPMKFVEEFGTRIVHLHCKDACRPADGRKLGRETRLGEGETRFVELFDRLIALGYRGPLTIEREIPPGGELDRDVADAIALLNQLKTKVR